MSSFYRHIAFLSIKLGFYLQIYGYIKKKKHQFFNSIKFLYCSFVIGTGKERLLIRRKHFTCFSGNQKKKKKFQRQKRIMKCRKTRKLSAGNKKHIHDLKGHSSLLQIHTSINSSHGNSFPLPGTTYSWYFLPTQKTFSNRDCKSKAGRHPIREYPHLQRYEGPR